MIGPLRTLDRWWMAPMPAERLASLRILIGGFAAIYVVARFGYLVSYSRFHPSSFNPVGVVAALAAPLPPAVVHALAAVCALAGVGFALGWQYRWVGPLFAALLLWVLTYRNSWGQIFHTDNLLVIHVLALAVAPAADAWSLDARGRQTTRDESRYGWPVKLLCVIVVVSYFLAGVAKLRFVGTSWAQGEVLRNWVAVDNLRKILLGSAASPLAGPLLAHPSLFTPLALFTLVVELGAPLALAGRRIAAAWVLAAVGFHWGVLLLMMIVFPYPMVGIAFACFFRPERLLGGIRHRMARSTVGASPPAR